MIVPAGLSSRDRLLAAGRALFGRKGYEQTSTAAIVRQAGSSESQLVRYFGGKSGLLEAIFDAGWSKIADPIAEEVANAPNGRKAIIRLLDLFITTFANDRELAFLFLLEARRMRGNQIVLSKGFVRFTELLVRLIERGQRDGSIRAGLDAQVIASAMIGCAEGMLRDAVILERTRKGPPPDPAAIHEVFAAMLAGLGAPSRPQ